MERHAVDHVLTTTVPVYERFQLERPVDPAMLEECIEVALRAPTSAHQQSWHFVVVTDPDTRCAIAALYARAVHSELGELDRIPLNELSPALACTRFLVKHMHRIPVLVIPCITWRAGANAGVYVQADLYSSILPAAWSLVLALRARGLGAAWTTAHLIYEQEVAQLLQIPSNVTQALLLPVAHCTWSDGEPVRHSSAAAVTSWNRWGARLETA